MIKHCTIFASLILISIVVAILCNQYAFGQAVTNPLLTVKKTKDFALTNNGTEDNWKRTKWVKLSILKGDTKSKELHTKIKLLYSDTGMYFLFDCEDHVLNATMNSDFMKLWKEDVVEVFLWPDINYPAYFEYELSPLNHELPILVSNKQGDFVRWRPFMYQNKQQTHHITYIKGGPKKSGAFITKWKAKIYVPFKLLRPLNNIPPTSGTKWRANFYRVDYDKGTTEFAWRPVEKTFHEYKKFGTILFD